MQNLPDKLYKVDSVVKLEQIAINQFAIPSYELMKRAGAAVFNHIDSSCSQHNKILVLCGAGNNAGDGYVVARLARQAGYDISVISLIDPVGNETTYAYDGQGRLSIETNDLGDWRSYDYDLVGNMVRTRDRNGRVLRHYYDGLDQLTSEQWRSGADPGPRRALRLAAARAGAHPLRAAPAAQCAPFGVERHGRKSGLCNGGVCLGGAVPSGEHPDDGRQGSPPELPGPRGSGEHQAVPRQGGPGRAPHRGRGRPGHGVDHGRPGHAGPDRRLYNRTQNEG